MDDVEEGGARRNTSSIEWLMVEEGRDKPIKLMGHWQHGSSASIPCGALPTWHLASKKFSHSNNKRIVSLGVVCDILSSIMQFPWHKQKIMLDNSIEAAEAITFWTETQTKKGRKYDKKWQSPSGHKEKSLHRHHIPAHLNMKIIMQGCLTRCRLMTRCRAWPADHARWGYRRIAFPVNDQCFTQTQRDYILQFVDRIDSLLDALLSREDLPNEHSTCSHCSGHQWAVWRCQDCSSCVKNACATYIKRTHSIEYNVGLVPIFEWLNYGKLAPIFWFPTMLDNGCVTCWQSRKDI